MTPLLLSIVLPDQQTIAATLWSGAAPGAVVLIHPGTGITQRYYEPFARYLAASGFQAVTYDYRGTGRSRPASLRGFKVTMADWIEDDVGAVTRWAAGRFSGVPLLAVGHSLGGHALALNSTTNLLCGAVLVASHAGVTATVTGWGERLRIGLVMRVLTPLLTSFYGYMPARKLGLGEDLPAGVMRQWSRWTSLPRYFFDDPAMDAQARMARVRLPLLVLGLTDDPWANPHAIDMLVAPLVHATVERRQIVPRDVGLAAIGHMGFFRQRAGGRLWPQVVDWLRDQASVPQDAPGIAP